MKIRNLHILPLIFCGFIFITSMCSEGNHNGENQNPSDTTNQNVDTSNTRNFSLKFIFNFNTELDENSGIAYYDSLLWTFNDGGDEAKIYGLNPNTGNNIKVLEVTNAVNEDWEDITIDDKYIYIGDFGNNSGSRRNLCIYKIQAGQISESETDVSAEVIEFAYEDQESFFPSYHSTSYDCEALFSAGDSLYVYTKDWNNLTTSLYKVPKVPGSYVAEKISDFNAGCLITGADYDEENKFLALIGYQDYIPVIFLSYGGYNIASNDSTIRHVFYESLGAQTEGIIIHSGKVFVTCEKSIVPASMYYLKEED